LREQLTRTSEEIKQRDASYRLELESVNQVHTESLRQINQKYRSDLADL